MKIIHHQYKSHPTLSEWVDPDIEAKKLEVEKALRVAIGRLKLWEHIEVQGVKLDGLTVKDVISLASQIGRDLDTPLVARTESNRARIWRVTKTIDWKKATLQSLEYGAVECDGMIEFKAKPPTNHKTPARPQELQTMKDQQDAK